MVKDDLFKAKFRVISKLSFLRGKFTKMMTRVNFWIFTNSPYIWIFNMFHGNNHYRKDNFQENSENSEFVQIRKFSQVIFMIFTQKKANFGSKLKFCNFSKFSPHILRKRHFEMEN